MEQLLPFVERWFKEDEEYLTLVALCYLHDIGKPLTKDKNSHLSGGPHSVISARIATELGAPDRLVQVILSHDRAYGYWRKLKDKQGVWTASRWIPEQRERFLAEFGRPGLDLNLLVVFNRIDNAYRRPVEIDESVDSVRWFENRLIEERLIPSLPEAGRDKRLDWSPA
ncbi:MAG: HDIG domain-containing protein [Deltaproteobacteria bacterium]|nr:HDIG domain-containing protein [Deltaproteobacteria bacterium]